MLFYGLTVETLFFIVLILGAAIYFYLQIGKNGKIASQAPTILTTFGIFATFFAIAWGLLNFDTANIQEGIPALLGSLKTAFWASVFGIAGALVIKIRLLFLKEELDYDEDFNRSLLSFNQKLLEEISLLRQENNAHLKILAEAQKEALEKLAKSSSEELVKALGDVVRDFNTKINEQFGDNFKQLNEAVGGLLEWQKRYKSYIEESEIALNSIMQAMQQTATEVVGLANASEKIHEDYQSVLEMTEDFADIAKNLEEVLNNLDQQRSAIQLQLTQLATIVSKASDDLPQIRTQILGIATTMQNSADEFNRHISDLTSRVSSQSDALVSGLEKALNESLEGLGGNLSAMTEKFANDYQKTANALHDIERQTQKLRGVD